jgi:hypothetical protein
MRTLDFSHNACKYFWYPPYYYAICPGGGWHIIRYNSFWDHLHRWGAPGRVVSDYCEDPITLLRTGTIDGRPLEEILQELPEDESCYVPPFAYSYEHFIADTSNRIEYLFRFRGETYFIDYWKSTTRDPHWIPGWIFSADRGTTILIHKDDFDEFIRQVNLWMVEHVGISLREMFDRGYKEDNSGELQLEMIDWCHL